MPGYVYFGSCVEPGGFALDDRGYNDERPHCKGDKAVFRSWETNDGGCINLHWSVRCPDCGYTDCDPFSDDCDLVELNDDTHQNWEESDRCRVGLCPSCHGGKAVHRGWEAVQYGTVNGHWTVKCPDCGFSDSDPFYEG